MASKLKAAKELLETGIGSLVKRPKGQYIRTEKQRLSQSLRAQAREKSTDTFKYEGKTYPKSEGVKAFYNTDRTRSGTSYKWTPKDVRGGVPGVKKGSTIPYLEKERKLIKDKMQELDKGTLKRMYGDDLVNHIKKTLNIVRNAPALQKVQQEVIGGGWKIGRGNKGAAGPDNFTYRGKIYPKSDGFLVESKSGKRWRPKFEIVPKRTYGSSYVNPVLAKERETIKTALEKIDKETLKRMSGDELLATANKIPGINRKTIPYNIREEVIGGGWKPKKGRTLIDGQLDKFSGINSLSPENFTKVGEFLSTIAQAYPKKKSSTVIKPIVDRMVKFAKRKGVPEEKIMKKLYETDIEGMRDIIIKNHELKKLWKEAKDLGLKPDFIDLTHIDAVSRNWEKALDPSNLIFANERSNRYLQKAIEEQIQILRKAIPRAKSLADKKMIAQQKIVLDPRKRQKHMDEINKPRKLSEMREDLAEANLVSEIGGTRRGAKIDPNNPYFADQISKDFREKIFSEQWSQAGGMNEGGIVNGYGRGGKIKKGLDKLLGSTAFNQSRRKFLKQAGATAAYTALPTKTLAALAPKAASKAAARFAPPWIKSMVGIFDSLGSGKSYMSHTMANGTKIKTLGGTADDYRGKMTPYEVTNSDGYKVPVNVFKEKNGNIDIEFDIRDDFSNNQHIYMDKKTGTVEIVDENYYMTGPEDYAKDDPLTWDVTTPTQMKDFEKKMGLMRGDGDDYIKDYMSTPEDGSYSDLFESFIDSFSPAGNIFHTKANAKKLELKKLQKKEADEMNWEEQFRGGSQHGYSHGGMANVRDKVGEFINPPNYRQLPAQANNWLAIQGNDQWEGLSKDQSRHKKTLSFDNPQSGIRAGIISLASRAARTNNSPKISLDQIFFGDSPWAENQGSYRQYFKDLNIPTNTIYDMSNRANVSSLINIMSEMEMGNEDYHSIDPGRRDHIINQGIDRAYERLIDPDYSYNSIYKNKFAEGGIARRPNAVPPTSGPDPYATKLTQAVSQINRNPGEFIGTKFIRGLAKGGFIKRMAPKVIGQPSQYKPQITGQIYQPPKGPYTITNDHGSAVLDRTFDTLDETNVALKEMVEGFKTQDATTFRVFGKRPPKTPEGVSEGAPEVEMGMLGKEIPTPDLSEGAMFWGSREKIIGAPTEAMTGTQWLDYMKRGKHGILNPKGYPIIKDMELNDTSLAPFLSRKGNDIVSKEKLVKEFDEMAPQFDIISLGSPKDSAIFGDIQRSLQTIDTQAIRNPAVKGFYDYMKVLMPQVRDAVEKPKELQFFASKIDDMVERNFGIKNVLDQGVPQRFPFEIKEIIQQLSQGFGKRTSGFKKYKKETVHKGTQMMHGGDNYREFLFKNKPGKLRLEEPEYKYAHEFNLDSSDRMGGVVHSRTSDRSDQFGRRLLHIEEIQSDMHQLVNAAQRKLKKFNNDLAEKHGSVEAGIKKMSKRMKEDYDEMVMNSKYAPRSDLKKDIIDQTNEQHLALILSKIEDLLVQPQTKALQTRLVRLNKERAKIRKIIADKRAKASEGKHSGIPHGPLSKTEDYNEFVMKYMLKVAREGGYDGISINSAAVKNKGLSPGSKDYNGNLIAYGPMARGAMKKVAKKSNANYMETAIMDSQKRGWEVPAIIFKDNEIAIKTIDKGLPVYKKGGRVKK